MELVPYCLLGSVFPPFLLVDGVTEALSLAGRTLVIVGRRGDAFFVPGVFGKERRC